jgi:hypothetical protein
MTGSEIESPIMSTTIMIYEHRYSPRCNPIQYRHAMFIICISIPAPPLATLIEPRGVLSSI